ncbi:MAG: AraC family transcriptional regulator [Chitinophagaceae bacterium]|nr:AraC family transcriptional regulator [Chitinophagaceae bacterium]
MPFFYPHLHRHVEIQITWILAGKGTLVIGNNMKPFQSGDLFVIGANQPHLFKSDPSSFESNNQDKVHSLNIFFNPDGFMSSLLLLPEMYSIKKLIKSSDFGIKASEKDSSKLFEYFVKVRDNADGFLLAYFIEMLQAMANMVQWEYFSTESFEHMFTDSDGLKMNDIFRYTMDHFKKEISLDQIAAIAHLTPQSFCRYFKKHTSKTYTHFVNELRINEACKLLMERKYVSIGNVAHQCGFNSVISFNRVFKSIISKTPREFIKTHEKKD